MPENNSNYHYDVFISYCHDDKDWVFSWLLPRLKAANVNVCIDVETFEVGVPSILNMQRAIEHSRKILPVLTPNWVKSEWTNFEALLVQTNDPIGLRRRVLPLMLEICTPPKSISIFTYADLTQPDQRERQFERILNAIYDKISLPQDVGVTHMAGPWRTPFILPHLDISTFTGRSEELAQLEQLILKRQGPKVSAIVVLAGAGGIGKSAVASHFAELHKSEFADGVIGLRVDGKDTNTIAREFVRCVGEEISPNDERDAATIMQDVFSHRSALLILDNADNASIGELRPGGNKCAVIITTRDRGLALLLDIPVENRIDLPPLPDPDSKRLLKRLLGEQRVAAEEEATHRIIELVGNLPLALQIVGCALRIQATRSLVEYATSLEEERTRLDKLIIRGDKNLDVRVSFSLSLKLLKAEEIEFFACLSVCAETGFSSQAAMAVGGCGGEACYECLTYLHRLSLLNRAELGEDRFAFHPLIHLLARELLLEHSLESAAGERHAHYFVQLVRSSESDDQTALSFLRNELENIVLAAKWLEHRGTPDYEFVISLEPLFRKYGYWEQAVDLVSGSISLAEGTEKWDAAIQLRIQQSKYLSWRGEFSRAEQTLAQIANLLNRISVPTIRQRYETMSLNELGVALQRQGHFDEALDTLKRCSAIAEQLGDQRLQANVVNSLGSVLQRLGHFDDALDAFQRCIDIEEQLGDKRGQAIVLNSLGSVLQRLGRYSEALNAFQRSYGIRVDQDDKQGQAIILNSLGSVLQRLGRFSEALDAFQRSYDIRVDQGDKRGQAIVLNSLGSVLQRMGRFNESLDCLQRCIDIEEQLGNERGKAMALNSMGGVLQQQGHLDEALNILQRSYDIRLEHGDKVGQTMALNSLGSVLQQQGRLDEALDAFQHSAVIAEQLGDRRTQVMALNGLGRVFQQQGCLNEALDTFQRSVILQEQLEDRIGQAMVLDNLGGLLQRQRRLDEAIDAFQRSATIAEQLDDFKHQAIVLNSLGIVLRRQGRLDEAIETFQRSATISERLDNRLGQAMAHTGIGKAMFSKGDVKKAVAELSKGFEIDESQGDSKGLAIVTPVLTQALIKLKRYDEALTYCRRALAVAPKDKGIIELHQRLTLSLKHRQSIVTKKGLIRCIIISASGYRYGFIMPEDGSVDIYFREDYVDPSYSSGLAEGVRVEVEVEPGPKGPRASKVKVID